VLIWCGGDFFRKNRRGGGGVGGDWEQVGAAGVWGGYTENTG